ncbi:hypothetical protein WG922_21370 [Ramlibacter sp. AN1015]|uniref:hypothetical protein n=1 Tax=Ramlibacter sp. AN1015 TaxID=3133428 RepID=UPI0030C12DC3
MKQRHRERRAWVARDWAYRWGKRCRSFHPECALCLAWRFYDESGRFPRFEDMRFRVLEAQTPHGTGQIALNSSPAEIGAAREEKE